MSALEILYSGSFMSPTQLITYLVIPLHWHSTTVSNETHHLYSSQDWVLVLHIFGWESGSFHDQ